MKKISKAFGGLFRIIRNPWLLNLVIDENENWKRKVIRDYNLSSGFPAISLEQIIPTGTNTLNSYSFLSGTSLPTDILLLKALCKKIEHCSYFEIGTWRGESVRNVSEAASECYTLNLSKEAIIKEGYSQNYVDSQSFFSKNIPNIIHLTGNSREYDFKKLNKKFDVVFIDGDHHHDSVVPDTKNVFENLIHENSIVVWHDYRFNTENIRYEMLYSILEGVPYDLHKYLYSVQNTMCAFFSKSKYDFFSQEEFALPDHTFKVDITIQKL